MFVILWFLFISLFISISIVWLIDHNGSVLIKWLGYQLETDVLTAIFFSIVASIVMFIICYIFTRILAIRFPMILKFLLRKTYLNNLEKIISRHHRAFSILSELMLALEVKDLSRAENLKKRFSKLVKNSSINNFLSAKILFDKQCFDEASEVILKIKNETSDSFFFLLTKFQNSIKNNENLEAIKYAQKILLIRKDRVDVARELLEIYQNLSMWQDANQLVENYKKSNFFQDFIRETNSTDFSKINLEIAKENYSKKNFKNAIKYVNKISRKDSNFIEANAILMKCFIRKGYKWKAKKLFKEILKNNHNQSVLKLFKIAYFKSSAKQKILIKNKLKIN